MSTPAIQKGRPLGWRHPQALGRLHVGIPATSVSYDTLPWGVHLCRLPGVYDQMAVGSCTANALAAAVAILHDHQGLPPILLDRMSLYWQARHAEGTVMEDAGALLSDVVDAVRKGYRPETRYVGTWSQEWVTPPAPLPHDAPRVVNSDPLTIDRGQIMYALASGFPVVVGVQIPYSWQTLTGDTLPLPGEPSIGGHAVCLVGYKRDGDRVFFRVRNSWGTEWGDGGYAWMPSEYITLGICGEAYALRAVRNLQG